MWACCLIYCIMGPYLKFSARISELFFDKEASSSRGLVNSSEH